MGEKQYIIETPSRNGSAIRSMYTDENTAEMRRDELRQTYGHATLFTEEEFREAYNMDK